MEVVTHFCTLMRLARAEAEAEKSGDVKAYEEAKAQHEAYKQLCLESDQMLLGMTSGQLSETMRGF